MVIRVQRLYQNHDYTGGCIYIDGKMFGFSLEDLNRDVKIHGQTRIPAGVYTMSLRKEGRMHQDYKAKFPFHQGMLWINNVPGFEYIYLHIGNTAKDSSGCILVGQCLEFCCHKITKSELAYRSIYPIISQALIKGETVTIQIVDELM